MMGAGFGLVRRSVKVLGARGTLIIAAEAMLLHWSGKSLTSGGLSRDRVLESPRASVLTR